MTNAADKIIVALDVATGKEALKLVSELQSNVGFFKIGLQLFTAPGAGLIGAVNFVSKLFLDLKLHDIPNTMANATTPAPPPSHPILPLPLPPNPPLIHAPPTP